MFHLFSPHPSPLTALTMSFLHCQGISCLLTVAMECKLKLNVEIEAPTLESEGEHQTHFNIAGSKQCSNNGFNTIEHIGRLLLFNALLSFQRFKELYASNIICTEDEPYKGLSNLLAPAGDLFSYLDDLVKSLDIQAYIRECVWTAEN
ncbi:hypothetical protein IGI04_030599 [Brassica rapa subsp. trilocularis]|uniref:Exocyst subunit Exo70 family protein n=1 Tax=Brassica rapa subsp. trilocularis TaxID=1813537 RepID=A0ABQ7LR71_BRACM|nr:hypothetical protein IGI04_030599 [Brassica rapa subsp. trilocularis]